MLFPLTFSIKQTSANCVNFVFWWCATFGSNDLLQRKSQLLIYKWILSVCTVHQTTVLSKMNMNLDKKVCDL